MGGFVPTAAMSALQIGFDAAQRSQRAKLEKSAQRAQAQDQVEQLRRKQEIERRQRAQDLKRAVAAQRARFGARGLPGGGSAEAVIAGLAAEAQRSDKDSRSLAGLRIGQINSDTDYAVRKSLLNATQPTYASTFAAVQKGLRNLPLFDS